MGALEATTEKGQTGPHGRVESSLPQVFGRYLLVQRLSRGGMGEIFLAKHGLAGFEKLAVIKKVLPHLAADQQFISRFVDEAQVAIKLQHVNVAQVFEVGRVGDEYFLALEYVEGRDLRRTLGLLGQRKQRLPVDLALFIGRELANGLAYAHRRTSTDGASLNLVHCDISPPNVLVSFEGETKVIDFGIAKSAIRGTATDPKMGFGKFGYMAPEQLIRGGVVDHRTDLYAAGVVLFELLTCQRLYEAGPEPDYRALAKKVAKGEHKMPSEIEKTLAPYDDLVATALRPKQEDRYQSAAEFRDAIQQCLVGVNPTISTDQLGAYMRELFAEEMTGQRELHERVAKAHLDDFKEQLTTQSVSTVSFALSNLPLKAPELPPPVPSRTRTPTRNSSESKPRPPTAQTDILPIPAAAPGTSLTTALTTDELSLADGTGTSVREAPIGRSRTPLVIGLVAGIMVVGAVIFAMTRGDSPSQQPKAVASAEPQNQLVTATPIDDVQPAKAGSNTIDAGTQVADPAVATVTDPAVDPDKVDKPNKTDKPGSADKPGVVTVAKPKHGKHDKRVDKRPDPARLEKKPDGLSRDAVIAKFRAVRHEYDGYAAKNGSRLDREWNDLADFINYHPAELDEFSRRIDAFRARMNE
ncbi:MAG: serine/threonine protein kinase [Myxococcales bacterium]|nr:serine/threonine protein kinase [Myxococcales bacterium]